MNKSDLQHMTYRFQDMWRKSGQTDQHNEYPIEIKGYTGLGF